MKKNRIAKIWSEINHSSVQYLTDKLIVNGCLLCLIILVFTIYQIRELKFLCNYTTLHYNTLYQGEDKFVERLVFTIGYYTILNYTIHYTISGVRKKKRFTMLHYTTPYTTLYGRQASVIGLLPYYNTPHYTTPSTTLHGGWCRSIPYPVVTHTLTRWRHGISKSTRGSEPNGTS